MKNCFTCICLLATTAAAWTVDLRNNYEESHTIYMKAGEPLDVLIDGNAGTGFAWVNNVDWQSHKTSDDGMTFPVS